MKVACQSVGFSDSFIQRIRISESSKVKYFCSIAIVEFFKGIQTTRNRISKSQDSSHLISFEKQKTENRDTDARSSKNFNSILAKMVLNTKLRVIIIFNDKINEYANAYSQLSLVCVWFYVIVLLLFLFPINCVIESCVKKKLCKCVIVCSSVQVMEIKFETCTICINGTMQTCE